MKRILFLLLTLSVFVGKAQNFEGTITWKITSEITDPNERSCHAGTDERDAGEDERS
jgi:hypothetical protein